MKYLMSQLMHFVHNRHSRIKLFALLRFVALLIALIVVYSIIFHLIMEYEGRSESWITGLYWTLTVMSTLGFGDITFQSDIGRIFSTIVLLSGIVFLLILLPFTFIEFFYEPWMQAQRAQRAPTQLPSRMRDHVIIINFDSVTKTLIEKLVQYRYSYVLIVSDLDEALRLHDLGYRVMLGDLDAPETYELARARQALAVVLTQNDQVNTNVAATVQDVSETVPIIATANFAASVDILHLAGADHILQLAEMMGQTLARRVSDGETLAHVVGEFDNLVIAEAMTRDTHLVGKTIRESCLRETTGLLVLGLWTRGRFELADPETLIDEKTVLVMAGSAENVARYNLLLQDSSPPSEPVLIIGGGRVGKATGRVLAARGLDYRIVEKQPSRILDEVHYVLGDAAELEVLEQGGIRTTPTVIVTTHDDDMNIYLTIYCRRLRPDVQIISRAGLERNIATLHRAGADFVLSYASTGANAIINLIGRDNILMVAEGLNLFEVEIPDALEGKSLAQSGIRARTGCTVVASRRDGKMEVLTDAHEPLSNNCRIVLVGTPDSEKKFLEQYKNP